MNPEVYLFALFVFGLVYLLAVFIRRMRNKDPQSQSKSFEQQNKLFRMYQNLEDLMDSFEAFAQDKQQDLDGQQMLFDERCAALEQRCSSIEQKCHEIEEKQLLSLAFMEKNPMPVVRVPSFERVRSGAEAEKTGIEAGIGDLRPLKVVSERNPAPIHRPAALQPDAADQSEQKAGLLAGEAQGLSMASDLAIKRSYEPAFDDLMPVTLADPIVTASEETLVRFPTRPGAPVVYPKPAAAQPVSKRARIIAMYENGIGYEVIARELGVTYTEIAMICGMAKKADTSLQPGKWR